MTVATKHQSYLAHHETWAALRAAYIGSGAVKPAGTQYLARPTGMRRQAQYDAYRGRAIWYGATERAVHGLTGAVFRREPTIEAPESLTPQLEDVTQTGVPLRTFAEQAVRETLLMGRFGVLVDFPQPLVTSEGLVLPPATSRPYWIAYQAEEIINWRTMQRQGDTILSLVVLHERVPIVQGTWPSDEFFVVKDRTQYRVLRLNEQGEYEVSVWVEVDPGPGRRGGTVILQDLWVPTRNGQPLDFLPFCFLAPFSLEPAIEKSLLEALVEINYQYYRHSADYEHGLHLTALPTPYVTGLTDPKTELEIGSAVAWNLPQGATAGMLEFHGAGLTPHETALENDVKHMAVLGARLLEGQPEVQETATAVRQRTQGSESPVQSLVRIVSQGLTQALQIHAWWGGFTENVDDTAIHLSLNTDLVAIQLEPTMLKELVSAWLSGAMSYETLYHNLTMGEVARPMIPVEDEQALIEIEQSARGMAVLSVPAGTNGISP